MFPLMGEDIKNVHCNEKMSQLNLVPKYGKSDWHETKSTFKRFRIVYNVLVNIFYLIVNQNKTIIMKS